MWLRGFFASVNPHPPMRPRALARRFSGQVHANPADSEFRVHFTGHFPVKCTRSKGWVRGSGGGVLQCTVSNFIDEAQIHVKAGNGGAGCVSFRREAHVDKGGPNGGDGGKGGDVWLVADRNVASLLAFKDMPHREATKGLHGSGNNKHGASGKDITVGVPVGTVIKDRSGNVVADLDTDGARWMAASGGRGGRGNARFLNNKRRAPAFAEQGELGEEFYFNLELRLMADVAIVGFPNAGKSTLISRISAAKPKIANYPFTTLEPNLGVVRYDDEEFTVADIPGLIEGASEGKGLGHKFLRHIERAQVLLILVDLASLEHTPEEQQRILLHELGNYDAALIERPRLIFGSRADANPDHTWEGEVISSVTNTGVSHLVGELTTLVTRARAERSAAESYIIHRPIPSGISIERDPDGTYVVVGKEAERAVALNDLTNEEAMQYVQHRLEKLGVYRALQKAGAREGDVVRIADHTFEYEPD
jgi:GTP-binding protein